MIVGILIFIITPLILIRTGAITGFAAMNTGCCELICQETSRGECSGAFQLGKTCSKIQECNVGCCIDKEGYCLSNYLKGTCEKKEYEFIATNECMQYPMCLIAQPPESIRGYTGYPKVFEFGTRGVAFAEPFSNTRGSPFTMKFYSLDNKTKDIKVKIYSEGFQKIISLYDDASHNDGNKNDGLYAGMFDTSFFPMSDGAKKLNFTAIINETQSNFSDYIIISSTKCLPIRKPWEDSNERKNVIFVSMAKNQNHENLFLTQTQNILGNMMTSGELRKESDNLNFYMVKETIQQSQISLAELKVKAECKSYKSPRDIIFFLDNGFEYCKKENNIIRTNPNIAFNQSALLKINNTNDFFENFCGYIMTQKEIEEKIMNMVSIPNVTLIMPKDNSTYYNSSLYLSFNVSNINNEELEYEVYTDTDNPLTLLDKGRFVNEKSINITLVDGYHDLWVEVEGLNGRIGYSKTSKILINVSDFVININSLDDVYFNESPEINFTISNFFETPINYTIFIENSPFKNGSTMRNILNTMQTNLTNGSYTLYITAKDALNYTTRSPPYEISIGNY